MAPSPSPSPTPPPLSTTPTPSATTAPPDPSPSPSASADLPVPVSESESSAPAPVPVSAPASAPDAEESGQLESLDEGQLKALLDEAVNYKRPKDREGKSSLFKELLQEVEQDTEPLSLWGRRPGEDSWGRSSTSASSRRRPSGNRRTTSATQHVLTHSGSLQDLVAEQQNATSASGRHHHSHRRKPPPSVPISARSSQGGSLPSNVDQHIGVSESFLEARQGGDYIATVHCVNPPPLGDTDCMIHHYDHRAPSPSSQNRSSHSEEGDIDIDRKIKSQCIPISYTTCATLEIGPACSSGGVGSTAVGYEVSPAAGGSPEAHGLVDMNKGCITSPIVAPSLQLAAYRAVNSLTGETNTASTSPPSVSVSAPASAHFNFQRIHESTSVGLLPRMNLLAKHEVSEYSKKTLDENANALQNASGQPKKTKKKKCKNEKEIKIDEGDDYHGRESIDVILKFIESDANAENVKPNKTHSKSNPSGIDVKYTPGKTKDDNDAHEKGAKKRSIERKSKEKLDKLKKSNSMEELFSSSALEDLTCNSTEENISLSKTKKQSTFDHSDLSETKRNSRRSWGNDSLDIFYCKVDETNSNSDEHDDTASSNQSSQGSNQNSKVVKKGKIPLKSVDTESINVNLESNTLETADFQTVTNKKKIRKRHSPADENRGRSNYYGHSYMNKNSGRFSDSFTINDKDNVYKRIGRASSAERRHPSVSFPASDKSNDSNDDLDSIHSLPAEVSGERLQASYADMARAATAATTPPRPPPEASPPVSTSNVQQAHTQATPAMAIPPRHHNFPDLIESCNYYSNDRPLERYADVTNENSKNNNSKEVIADKAQTKNINTEPVTQVESTTIQPIYSHDQYPALESRLHKTSEGKPNFKVKTENKIPNGNVKTGIPLKINSSEKKYPLKIKSLVDGNEESIEHDQYTNIINHNIVDNGNHTTTIFRTVDINTNPTKQGFKIESYGCKPPDVVLPLTDASQNNDKRPAVIIMDEEHKKVTESVQSIVGITFGFDINEQLLNGEISNDNSIDSSECADESLQTKEVIETGTILYNSNIEFPPISDKSFKDHSKSVNNSNHIHYQGTESKRPGRPFNGEINNVQKTNTVDQCDDIVLKNKDNTQMGQKSLRYLAPTADPKDIYNLEKIVHYVGMAWEDIVKSPGNKVKYFSEQQ